MTQVNIEARSHNKDTPLSLAAYFGHADAVALLMRSQADIQAVDADGNRPGDLFDDKVSTAAQHAVRTALTEKR